jgi:hypothetical protein
VTYDAKNNYNASYVYIGNGSYVQVGNTSYLQVNNASLVTTNNYTYVQIGNASYLQINNGSLVTTNNYSYVQIGNGSYVQVNNNSYVQTANGTHVWINNGSYVQILNASYITVDGLRAFTGVQSMGNHAITNVDTATAGGDATNKTYVDAADTKHIIARLDGQVQTASLIGANITGLSFWAAASTTYQFDGYINNGNSGTNGNKYSIYMPAGGTLVMHYFGDTTAATAYTRSKVTANGTLTTEVYHTVADQNGYTILQGTYKNGANAGTVTLMFASVTAGTVTANAGSYLNVNKMASATAF